MQDSCTVDELDQQLVHALQLVPRAPWQHLGELLDADPVTLARRWKRLRDGGVARVTAALPAAAAHDFTMAFVELDCAPSRTIEVARLLAGDPQVQTLYACTGQYDLFVTVHTADLTDLGTYLTERIGHLDGVRAIRSRVLTDLLLSGATWELRALSPVQRGRLLAERASSAGRRPPGPLIAQDQRIFDELMRDGRISYSDLASRLGVSASTARRWLNRLLDTGTIGIRCDIAKDAFGWPASVTLWCATRSEVDSVQEMHTDIPEIRLCGAVTGSSNLAFVLWLRRLSDLKAVERKIRGHLPDLVVAERTVLLETVKLSGHMLDRRGRPLGVVPTNVWTPIPS